MRHLMMLTLILGLITGVFAHSMMSARAEEPAKQEVTRYYTSVQIKEGESLWSIAREYADQSEITITQYIEELKQMNGLQRETIHAGEYLTVVYFE